MVTGLDRLYYMESSGVVPIGLDDLEVVAASGGGDLDKYAATLSVAYAMSKKAPYSNDVPPHAF